MFFVFGFGYTTTYNYQAKAESRCPRCGSIVHFQLTKIKKWFTLFFIPVIPYETKYYVRCPECPYEIEVDKINFSRPKDNRIIQN